MGFARYALYWLPDGALGTAGAEWLGWDARAGEDRSAVVAAPKARRYGFHATLKPPFRLVDGADAAGLATAAARIAAGHAPAALGRLEIATLGTFLALRPERRGEIAAVAAALVEGLDRFRRPTAAEDLARRRQSGLSQRQEALLTRWGYPYVMEEFRPHLTLSDGDASEATAARAGAHFAPCLDRPLTLGAVSLVGEGADGRFHLVRDLPLGHCAT